MKGFCKKIALFILGLSLIGVLASCTHSSGGNGGSSGQTLLAPVFTPSSGEYREGYKEITIQNMNSQGDIFFTTDGSTPTIESPRYTEAFKIYSSKTIKAICIYNKSASPVASAKYELNAGKTQSQMGVITGKVGLSNNLSESVKETLANADIFIFSADLPGVVKSCKLGESYYFDGLDTSKTYDFYFTNVEPGVVQGSRAATAKDENGHPIVANKNSIKPEAGAGIEVDVNLAATGTIKGNAKRFDVTGTEEKDHGGIVVYIPGTSYSAYTDEDGNFTMSGVPQGLHTIRAQYSGYSFVEKENVLLQTKDENAPETVIEDTFNLAFGKGIVNGSVVLSDATDIGENAGILISLSEPTNTYAYSATTNLKGNFSIVDVYPGTYTIEMSKEGYSDTIISEIKVTGAAITTIPTTTLQVIGGSLSGKVTVNGVTDYSGVTVLAENENGKKYFGIANSNGEFSWDKVSPGTYKITANLAGYKSVSVSDVIVSLGSTVNEIQLMISEKATYTITGKVLREGMDSGFEGTSVVADNALNKSFSKTAITGIDGTYILSELEPGDYMITISREGYITDNSNYVSVGTSAIEVIPDVILKNSLGSVKGTVQLESALEHEGIDILLKSEKSDKTYNTVTDTLGRFSISGIAPGTWRIQATKSGYNTVISDSFSVNAGNTAEVPVMELKISHRSIYGTVLLEGRTDATGVRITATNVNKTNEIYSALSNKDGVYALSGMTPGEYILSYSYEGYRSYTGSSVNLKNDSSLNLEAVTLIKATGKISGIVNLEGCSDHSGIEVSLVGTDYTYVTEEDGAYEFTVPSGNYPGGVRFSREDFQLTAKADTIPVLTDSTYGVLTVEMKCISVPVNGVIDLLGTNDDSGIKVTVDGLEGVETLTDSEGKWKLEHIPLGYRTFRFTKLNVPDVTSQHLVEPCNSLDVGTIEMIPDSATLKGFVSLDGMTDNSNIIVTVSTLGKDNIVVRTNAAGSYEVTNVLASGSHDVTFSKEGWDSQTLTVSGLTPLEVRNITSSGEYVLKDTTNPVLTKVEINGGANFTNKPKIEVALTADDKGSGLNKMAVQVSRKKADGTTVLFPSEKAYEEYKVSFEYDLSALPSGIWANNDEYTLHVTVKDKSGNESETKTDIITITDQASILKGVLTGDDLHLTKAKSPYRVESNILCQEGDTLEIDPGVEIRFAGDFYLKVDGCIKAIGTDAQHIVFTKTEDCPGKGSGNYISCDKTPGYPENHYHRYYDDNGNLVSETWSCYERVYDTEAQEWKYPKDDNGNDIYRYIPGHLDGVTYWSGLQISNASAPLVMEDTYRYVSGNTLQYCDIEYSGKNDDAGSSFVINKSIFMNECNVKVSNSAPILFNNLYESLVMNSVFDSGIKLSWTSDVTIINSVIRKYIYSSWGTVYFSNNIFESISQFSLSNDDGYLRNNVIRNFVPIESYNTRSIVENNIFEDSKESRLLKITSSYSSTKVVDFTENYWGPAQTEELNLIGNNKNASFITDYYDDFELTRVDYSDWAQEPFENCGYLGDKFIDFELTINGSTDPDEPSEADISVSARELYAENTLVSARFALSSDELATATWGAMDQTLTLTRSKTKDGFATVYAQTKDSNGNLSPVKTLKVAYDDPVITFANAQTSFSGNSTDAKIEFTLEDQGLLTGDMCSLKLNGIELSYISCNTCEGIQKEKDDRRWWYSKHKYEYKPNIKLMAAGDYTLTVTVVDSVGNEVTKDFNFKVTRDVNTSSYNGTSFNKTTGQLIKDEKTAYLWHFDGDTKEADGADFATLGKNWDRTEIYSEYSKMIEGGINGAASRVYGGYNEIPLNSNSSAFSVEYWQKGETWDVIIRKEDLFSIENYKGSKSSYYAYNHLYYAPDESSVNYYNMWSSDTNKKSDNDWHYFCHVFADTYMAVYRDGQLMTYHTYSKINLNTEGNTNNLSIDFNEYEGTSYDELRVSTCARTPDEIKAYYDCAVPLYNPQN